MGFEGAIQASAVGSWSIPDSPSTEDDEDASAQPEVDTED